MIYVAPTAIIVGDVTIRNGSSVWYGAVLRGDLDGIFVGEHCSIQDNAVVHVDKGNPAVLGDRITVGHGAIVHGCTIGDESIVGMGATVASRAKIGGGSIVAAGAVVAERAEFPPNSVIAGVPARWLGESEDRHRTRIDLSWRIYAELAAKTLPSQEDREGDRALRVRVALTDEFEKL